MNSIHFRRLSHINWSTIVLFSLGFWLSGSLLLDCLVIPGLLTSGMMNQEGFASAGYLIFGTFNHVELICSALVLSGCLVLNYQRKATFPNFNKYVFAAISLVAIAFIYTYFLTPQMSGLGLTLDNFSNLNTSANSMGMMHVAYWALEIIKIATATILLSKFYRNSCSLV